MSKKNKKNFAIIGVGGFVAPRHLKAIKETGHNLVAAMDINDSVGVLDSYFPHVPFFTKFEDFHIFLEKYKKEGNELDYISICTPNHMHVSHIRFAKTQNAIAICEKPLLTSPDEVKEIEDFEKHDGGWKVYTIMQVREHPSIKKLKKKVEEDDRKDKYEVELTYTTSRGPWYMQSWKGDEKKSGGVAVNIGVHFFDLLIWMFGPPINSEVHYRDDYKLTGYLELERANVSWYLSIDREDLLKVGENEKSAYRSIKFDGKEIEFSNVFSDLHTVVYEKILDGEGTGVADAKPAILLLHDVRNVAVSKPKGKKHHHLYKKL